MNSGFLSVSFSISGFRPARLLIAGVFSISNSSLCIGCFDFRVTKLLHTTEFMWVSTEQNALYLSPLGETYRRLPQPFEKITGTRKEKRGEAKGSWNVNSMSTSSLILEFLLLSRPWLPLKASLMALEMRSRIAMVSWAMPHLCGSCLISPWWARSLRTHHRYSQA